MTASAITALTSPKLILKQNNNNQKSQCLNGRRKPRKTRCIAQFLEIARLLLFLLMNKNKFNQINLIII